MNRWIMCGYLWHKDSVFVLHDLVAVPTTQGIADVTATDNNQCCTDEMIIDPKKF